MPVTRGKWWIYHLITLPAMLINVHLVGFAMVRILVRDIHATTDSFGETKEPVWQSDSKFSSAIRIFFLLSPLLSSLADSIFDGLYFVRLQIQPRMIHVPTGIHVVQGFLIYLGELRLLFKVLKVFQLFSKTCSQFNILRTPSTQKRITKMLPINISSF